ncbi:MAG: radical SAM protein [Verrucomicrobiota bacterium]
MNMDLYRECRLCPRDCGVNRVEGKRGICRETAVCRISSAGPHFGEEPSFTGTRGSGAIFFTGCSSRCFFCQNVQISIENLGEPVTPEQLVAAARRLIKAGVHNLNFVTPDHFWPHIEHLCAELRREGISIPTVFNSSGYQRPDMVEKYAEFMDLFMPDFKFAQPALAGACMGDERYPEIALESLRKMLELKGFLEPWDPSGAHPAQRGVLVRHLILPGHVENTLAVLRLLRKEFGKLLPLSVMSQFHPMPLCFERGQLARRISADEHRRVYDLVIELEFQHVYIQNLAHDIEFLPDFSDPEPFKGNLRRR